jgi:hypothetical protein
MLDLGFVYSNALSGIDCNGGAEVGPVSQFQDTCLSSLSRIRGITFRGISPNFDFAVEIQGKQDMADMA